MEIRRIETGTKGWSWNEEEKYLGNPKFGRIQLVSVCDKEGREIYQQPVWLEQRAEIDIVVNERQQIAFIETVRHALILPAEYADKWNDWGPQGDDNRMLIPHPADLQTGVSQLEIPRGGTNIALREAEEETGYKVEMVEFLGCMNMNTAWFGTSPFVYVCKALPVPSEVPPDLQEVIRKVVWLSPEEAKEVDTLCGTSYAVLFLLRRWALKQEDSFWRGIGERL